MRFSALIIALALGGTEIVTASTTPPLKFPSGRLLPLPSQDEQAPQPKTVHEPHNPLFSSSAPPLSLRTSDIAPRSPQQDDGPQSGAAEAAADGHSGGYRSIPTTPESRRRFRIAHGVIMGTTFTVFLPAGVILMHFTQNAYLHGIWQSVSYCCAIAGMGLGIWLGRNVRYLDYAHTVIGMAVLGALVFQVAFGVRTHLVYAGRRMKEEQGIPMARPRWPMSWGFVHRWLGRVLIALGMINGGLGLMLAGNTRGGMIAYGVVAGVSGLIFLVVIFKGEWRRYNKEKATIANGTGPAFA